MNTFAEKMRALRTQNKMTTKQLAKACGLAESYILQVESGKKVANEESAEKIMTILGGKAILSFEQDVMLESSPAPLQPIKRSSSTHTAVNPGGNQQHAVQPVDAKNQWADALSGIVHTYPIHDLNTMQAVGSKVLPIFSKKVEGLSPEKLRLIQLSDDSLSSFRLMSRDIVWIEICKEAPKEGLYLISVDQKLMIRWLKRIPGNQWSVSKKVSDEAPAIIPASQLIVEGRCFKSEFSLLK